MSRPQGTERVGVRTGSALAAFAAALVASAAPAAASGEPPPDGDGNDAPEIAADEAPATADEAPATADEAPATADEAPATAAAAREADEALDEAAPAAAPAATPEAPVAPPAPAALAAAQAPAASVLAMAHAGAAPAPSLTAAIEREEAPSTPRIGAGLDIGLPDGATVSIVARPIRALRAHAGLSHNAISLGERVGLTWVPLSWWVSPTLSVEYGHYADGNANPLVRMVSGDASLQSAILDRVGYDYANAHLGLELGRRWFTFYLHAGYSRITGTVHNLTAEAMSQSSGTTSVTFSQDPSVRLWSVSARTGFIVYLAK